MSEKKRIDNKPAVAIATVPRVRQREPQPEVVKVEPEIIKKVEPERKRVSGEVPISEVPKIEAKPRSKASTDKYIRFSFEDMRDINTINSINKQKINDEIKYAYYATDNDIGYHYFLITKKQ